MCLWILNTSAPKHEPRTDEKIKVSKTGRSRGYGFVTSCSLYKMFLSGCVPFLFEGKLQALFRAISTLVWCIFVAWFHFMLHFNSVIHPEIGKKVILAFLIYFGGKCLESNNESRLLLVHLILIWHTGNERSCLVHCILGYSILLSEIIWQMKSRFFLFYL